MVLKDLIISQDRISEEIIEKILSGRVQLLAENQQVHLLSSAKDLPSSIRILMYLAGKKAWSIIKKRDFLTPIVELSDNLGIKGNTLRPLLKNLRDEKLVESKSGTYRILPMGIVHLQQYPEKVAAPPKDRKETRFKMEKRKKVATKGVSARIRLMIEEKFFETPKSLNDIREALKKNTYNIPRTSMPKYLIRLVRRGLLKREKSQRGKKNIWMYKIINKYESRH
jgi:DNA-binding transcriptional MocR family regulator